MHQFIDLRQFRRRSTWLLFLGILGMALHALAATGLMAGAAANQGGKVFAEVCTSHGVVKADLSLASGGGTQPAGAGHYCCKLCAAGGSLLLAGSDVGVPPAPTFAARHESRYLARPTSPVRSAHSPRGPPESA